MSGAICLHCSYTLAFFCFWFYFWYCFFFGILNSTQLQCKTRAASCNSHPIIIMPNFALNVPPWHSFSLAISSNYNFSIGFQLPAKISHTLVCSYTYLCMYLVGPSTESASRVRVRVGSPHARLPMVLNICRAGQGTKRERETEREHIKFVGIKYTWSGK